MVRYWGLVIVDLQRCYGVNLHDEFAVRPWRWFRPLVTGLMYQPDSLLRHALTEQAEKEDQVAQVDEALG